MYFKNENQYFTFLYEFLDLDEFKAILPDYFFDMLDKALHILLRKSLEYLKDKNITQRQEEFFAISMFFECLTRVLIDWPLEEHHYKQLAFLIDDTDILIRDEYPLEVDETPTYSKFIGEVYDTINHFLGLKQENKDTPIV